MQPSAQMFCAPPLAEYASVVVHELLLAQTRRPQTMSLSQKVEPFPCLYPCSFHLRLYPGARGEKPTHSRRLLTGQRLEEQVLVRRLERRRTVEEHKDMAEVEAPVVRCRNSQGLPRVQEEHGGEAELEVAAEKRHDQQSSRVARHPLVRSLWLCWWTDDVGDQCCTPKEAHPHGSGGWMMVGQGTNMLGGQDLHRSELS